jgi:2,3-bisphosphoglycerate-dependent phosphoglycerate mutase
MSTLVLLRHGQSIWNLENRFTGFVDIDLSEKGIEEAKGAGALLKPIKFDKVYTSTLKRAYRTAELALAEAGQSHVPTIKHDDLRERDYGDLTGLNKDETRQMFGEEQVRVWRRSYDMRPPNGESLQDVVSRVKPYYESHILPDLKAGKNILLAAHGNTLRAMLIILGKNTTEDIEFVDVATGVPMILEGM